VNSLPGRSAFSVSGCRNISIALAAQTPTGGGKPRLLPSKLLSPTKGRKRRTPACLAYGFDPIRPRVAA